MATLVPIHISLLSACLKAKGFDVSLFDTTYYKTEDVNFEMKKVELLQVRPFSLGAKGISFKQTDMLNDLRLKIYEYQPNLIAFTAVEDTWDLTQSLLHSINDINIPTIVGGVFVTFSPEEVLGNPDVDMICVGEGEEPLVELCEKMAQGEDYSTVKNLWVKTQRGIIKNPMRPLIDINQLPFIDFDIFGRERLYRPMFGKIFTMIHVELDRGCPYTCTYCEAPHLRKLFQDNNCGVYYRKKTPERMMAEMKFLTDKYHPDYVNFNSETFLAKPVDELKEFAARYKEINIPFWCQTRPETITEEKVKILKEMNCDCLQFGIEHGNAEFRARILNRHCTNDVIINALHIVEKYQIPYTVNNILGFPDETRELVFDTIRLNREIHPRTMNWYLFTPYKGTTLHKYCVDHGYLDPAAKVHQLLDSVQLKMDTISYEELKGLQRTCPLYVKFSETEWDKIKRAEKFDDEGNRVFAEYQARYRELFFK